MNNELYRKMIEDFQKTINQVSNMIVELAKRTLSAKEYTEFMQELVKQEVGEDN